MFSFCCFNITFRHQAIDPEAWIQAATNDLCFFIDCQEIATSMTILRIRNITKTRTGIVLLQGIEQINIEVANPKVWGLPALSTQYRTMEIVFKNPQADGKIYSNINIICKFLFWTETIDTIIFYFSHLLYIIFK